MICVVYSDHLHHKYVTRLDGDVAKNSISETSPWGGKMFRWAVYGASLSIGLRPNLRGCITDIGIIRDPFFAAVILSTVEKV